MTPYHSPSERLARVAHPCTSRERNLAMIAYFDESGMPDDKPIVTVAAFVARDLKWRRFDVKWMDALRVFKAPIHKTLGVRWFHMTDFESPFAEPYNEWKKEKRISFASTLAELQKMPLLSAHLIHWLSVIGTKLLFRNWRININKSVDGTSFCFRVCWKILHGSFKYRVMRQLLAYSMRTKNLLMLRNFTMQASSNRRIGNIFLGPQLMIEVHCTQAYRQLIC